MANTTWNPSDKTANVTLSGGNLIVGCSLTLANGVRSISRQRAGRFYWEITLTNISGTNDGFGVCSGLQNLTDGPTIAGAKCVLIRSGSVYLNGSNSGLPAFGTLTAGSVVCIAADFDNSLIWYRIGAAGNWNNNASYNPATGAGGVYTGGVLAGLNNYALLQITHSASSFTANFGDSAFTGTAPSGFTAGFPDIAAANVAEGTQTALEQWAMPNASAQVTQLAAEEWGTVVSGARLALLTQIALEEWARVPLAVPRGGQTIVTVNSG